jgi:hypothetical protein
MLDPTNDRVLITSAIAIRSEMLIVILFPLVNGKPKVEIHHDHCCAQQIGYAAVLQTG